MDCQIGEMRATVFTSPIVYDENNVKRVTELLSPDDGYVANPIKVATVQIVPGLKINVPASQGAVPTEWEMVSEKQMLRIHFGPQKIDIVKSKFNAEQTTGYEAIFCEWAKAFFEKIAERFSLVVTRLAFAPTYAPDWTKDFNKKTFNAAIYKKNPFKSPEAANLLFKQVFRVSETLGDRGVLFNYVAEASEGQSVIENLKNKSLTVKQMLNLSLDINTYPDKDVEFSVDEMNEFFNNAPQYAKDFLEYYVG
ncbi:MAG: hypothetical protein J5932_03035 [Prevotella sp.]|nr:hypothetical protein [Prevotella sp.]MBP3843986.1 hypothetical protein [Prevotella sp.]